MRQSVVLVFCFLVGFGLQESLRTKVEQVLQNEDLLKLIKAFKSTDSEKNKDSESLLSDTLSKFGKILGDEHIQKVDLTQEKEQNLEKLHKIEQISHTPNQEVLVTQMQELIDPAIEEPGEEHNRIARHFDSEPTDPAQQKSEDPHPLIKSHVENQQQEPSTSIIDEYSTELKKDDKLLVPVDDHLSQKMEQEIRENEEDMSILGIKQSKFNIEGILSHLTKKMIKHGPGLHKHLGRIKKHIDSLKNANLIDHEHLDTIKSHVDMLHEHVGVIAANQNADHLGSLRDAARKIVTGATGIESDESENIKSKGTNGDQEIDLSKLEELEEAKKLLGDIEAKGGLSTEGREEEDETGQKSKIDHKTGLIPEVGNISSEVNKRSLEQLKLDNLNQVQELIKNKLGGIKNISGLLGKNNLVSFIGNKFNPQGSGSEFSNPEASKFFHRYKNVKESLKFLRQRENMRLFLHGLLVESQNFEDSEFCNKELDLLTSGFVELPELLNPLLNQPQAESPAPENGLSGLKIFDQIIKIEHITTKSISKDKFLQKCIHNSDDFKSVVKVSILKSMLYPEIFTDASLELMSLGVSFYSLSSNLKNQNYEESGAQLWRILGEIKEIEVEGVDNSRLMEIDFSRCQQAWLTERAAILRSEGHHSGEPTSKKIREICLGA